MCITKHKHKSFYLTFLSSGFTKMARGHQKIQSQQKNAKKQAEMKKAKGHDQKTAAKAALVFTCLVCRVSISFGTKAFYLARPFISATIWSVCNHLVMEKLGKLQGFCHSPFLQSQMPDPKTFKQHFESKHPKSPLPPELEGVEA